MTKQLSRRLKDEAATLALGAQLAPLLDKGDMVALSGELGSGKTTLARGLIRALCGQDQQIPSPTFTLIQTYHAHIDLWHVDLYRLDERREIAELGLLDALAQAALIVEWPEKMRPDLPQTRLEIKLAAIDDFRARIADIIAHGQIWEKRLDELRS